MKLLLPLLLLIGLSFPCFSATKTITLTKNNHVMMRGVFNTANVDAVKMQLGKLAFKTRQDLYLVLYSPGGSITAGQSLIDFINALPNKVHTITLFAASMAYITVQSLGTRYVAPSGMFMSHRARIGGLSGQVPGEAVTRLRHIMRMVNNISRQVAKRIGVPFNTYQRSIQDELWLGAQDAVDLNHADQVVNVRCGQSLKGTYTETVNNIFGAYKVSFSKCPLIRGPVKINTKNTYIHEFIRRSFDFENKKYFEMTF